MFKFKAVEIPGLILILVTAGILRLQGNIRGFFAFAFDQGKDFIEVSKIIYEGNLTLIGPNTGLPGIFYGPSWYYFLAPILLISGGDPKKVAIFFSFIGILTVFGLYFVLKILTKNVFVSFSFALIAAMFGSWMIGPIFIWSPSLAPLLMLFFIYLIYRIQNKPKSVYYFLLGVVTIIIGDMAAAYGISILLSVILLPIFFGKYFFRKEYLYTLLGIIITISPRIIFELRNDFLMTRSFTAYLKEPIVHGESFNFVQRFINNSDLFLGLLSDTIARSNKLILVILFIPLVFLMIYLAKDKKIMKKLVADSLIRYLLFLLTFLLIIFSIYKDIVWDYYLIGLPVIFTVLLAKIFGYLISSKIIKIYSILFLVILILININTNIFSTFKITWEGGDSEYRNQKMVMDYIAFQKPTDFTIHSYSPAIYDHPFNYLINWYQKKGLLNEPKEDQNLMYLIIRDDEKQTYLSNGWYGDKTKDNTNILERKEFPGGLIIEKHLKND